MCRSPDGWTPERTRGFIAYGPLRGGFQGESSIVNELRIEKWVYGGDGLGRLDGRVVLAPFVLPGELARVDLKRANTDLLRATRVEILDAAADRVTPACPYFARCGGCHYQHAPYEYQLARKREILGEVLRRVGKIEPPADIALIAGPPWEYRNRAQFHLHSGRIGYHEAGSRRLCPIERCPISSPVLNGALTALRAMMRQPRFPRFLDSIELFTNETSVQVNVREQADRRIARSFIEWCAGRIPGAAEPALEYSAAGFSYRVSHRSFFQVNRFLIDKLVETALEGAAGESAVDLYAGVGLFSLPLARRFSRLTAVESADSPMRDLEWNAARAGLAVVPRRETAEMFLENMAQPPDFLLADPPRSGMSKAVVGHLARLQPRQVTIVSCDPSTLARDLAVLLGAGYRLAALTLVDLFPQTFHMETVARLTL